MPGGSLWRNVLAPPLLKAPGSHAVGVFNPKAVADLIEQAASDIK
jgi:hypothetical protein